MPVDFGNGIVTTPTTIGVITKVEEYDSKTDKWYEVPQTDWDKPTYAINSTMGVGWGSNDSIRSPIRALPTGLNEGFLMNEPAGQLVFGPNPLPPVTSIDDWYNGTLEVEVSYLDSDKEKKVRNNVTIDSGGTNGSVPHDALPPDLRGLTIGDYLPVGTTISLYTRDGLTLLYSSTITEDVYSRGNGPTVSSESTGFNTGYAPFLQGPIYFAYTPEHGTATWDYAPL